MNTIQKNRIDAVRVSVAMGNAVSVKLGCSFRMERANKPLLLVVSLRTEAAALTAPMTIIFKMEDVPKESRDVFHTTLMAIA